jgi:hypothetical protein
MINLYLQLRILKQAGRLQNGSNKIIYLGQTALIVMLQIKLHNGQYLRAILPNTVSQLK